jgi:diguanylate cyclase (GGDEF)-like protein/PAS domain S-box-containing protein
MQADGATRLSAPELTGGENLLSLQVAALEAAANPILISRRDGTIIWVNKAFEQLSGYTRDEALGQNTRLLRSGQQSPDFFKDMWETILSGQKWRGELVNRRKDGSLYPEEMTITPVRNAAGEITHFIAIKLDITERKLAEEQIRQLAQTDPLTGLANHRRLLEALDSEIKRCGRTTRSFAVLLLDLDDLKKINDDHGHQVGSRALSRVANILRIHCRANDTAARYGGDEFVVVLPETGCEAAHQVAQRISEESRNDGDEPAISVSVGAAVFPQDGKTIDELLAAADRALYREKRSPKGRSSTEGDRPSCE